MCGAGDGNRIRMASLETAFHVWSEHDLQLAMVTMPLLLTVANSQHANSMPCVRYAGLAGFPMFTQTGS
jgi:hypothetical protein